MEPVEQVSPITPVYLHQELVFDYLAMLHDGFSDIRKVTTEVGNESTSDKKLEGKFGLGAAVASLLSVSTVASNSRRNSKAKGRQIIEERVHTPSSLLFQLLETLKRNKCIVAPAQMKVGSIVNFSTTLRNNPIDELIEFGDKSNALLEFALKHNFMTKERYDATKPKDLKSTIEFLKHNLPEEKTRDFIGYIPITNISAPLTIDRDFLRYQNLSSLTDGQFWVLGKVVRTELQSSEVEISFVRRSVLSKLGPSLVDGLIKGFGSMSQIGEINLSPFSFSLPNPAVHIIPIAIYA